MAIGRKARAAALAGCVLLACTAGCSADAVRRTAPQEEARFAREYIRTLRDSGVTAVLPRTKSSTREAAAFQADMERLRNVLAASTRDSLHLTRWEVDHRPGRPTATQIVYSVAGIGSPFEVGMWIEQEAGKPVVETIFFGPPKS